MSRQELIEASPETRPDNEIAATGQIESRNALLTPQEMIGQALESGAGIEVLERLLKLQERWEASNAKKAFEAAMAEAKGKLPAIIKNREVDFTTGKGRTNYKYEDLSGVIEQIRPVLNDCGLSFRWTTDTGNNDCVSVTCIVSHRDGHRESVTLSGKADHSGNKNAIQAMGSAVTYLQRYTLKAALGLAAAYDDDGRGGPEARKPEPTINEDEQDVLLLTIKDTQTDIETFCRYYAINALSDLPVSKLPHAMKTLTKKQQRSGS